jgi:nucleoside-diphosphate-sugar epimerase
LDLSQGDVYATSRFNTLEGHSGLSYLDKLISEDDSRWRARIFQSGPHPDQPLRVCVTGATGFIASHLVAALVSRGYDVVGTVRSLNDNAEVEFLKKLPGAEAHLTLMEADLELWNSFDGAIRDTQCDAVFHVAAPFLLQPEQQAVDRVLMKPTVDGTFNVLSTCRRSPSVRRVLLTGCTAAVVGAERLPKHIWTEADWSDPKDLAARMAWLPLAKTTQEQEAWEYMRATPVHFDLLTILPCMTIGPLLGPRPNGSLSVVLSYLNGSKQRIPKRCLTFVDVRDVALAHIAALESPSASGRHLVVGSSITADHFCAILRRAAPWAAIPNLLEDREQEPLVRYSTQRMESMGLSFRSCVCSVLDTVQSLRERDLLVGVEDHEQVQKTIKDQGSGRIPVTALTNEAEFFALFNTFDVDSNGWMSKEEFRGFLSSVDTMGMPEDTQRWTQLLDATSERDKISFDEFALMMLKLFQR